LLEDKYAPAYRREADKKKVYKNTTWNLSRRLICHHCYFAVASSPLTERLNNLNTGYEEHSTDTKVSHLLNTDDLKLIGKT
jgi:hypothetical protein